jgi:tight adherence protein C
VTTTTALSLLGALAGVGIVLVLAGISAARPALEAELARLDPYGRGAAPTAPGSGSRVPFARPGAALLRAMDRLQGDRGKLAADLALADVDMARQAASVTAGAVVGAVSAPALAWVAGLAGAHVGWSVPLAACLPLAAAGAAWPVVRLGRAARAARAQFRQALASWLELVALAQAAGMGLESALQAAAGIAADPSFRRIRQALDLARATGEPPWRGLSRLGTDLALPDLEELGATLELAGAEGARIRTSLASKAASMRRRQLAEAEAAANATTERLFFPSVLLMFGFVIFVGYPALVTVTRVL